MPRFFFHVRDDLDVPDHEGTELPTLEAAVEHAAKGARDLMCGTLEEEARISLHHRIDIEDETGRVIQSVTFRDAVRVEG